MVRTISAVLVSSPARPYLHVTPVPASTNEMGILPRAFDELMSIHSRADLFRSVTQRSAEARAMPWKRLLRHVSNTLVSATAEQLQGLRRRRLTPLPA